MLPIAVLERSPEVLTVYGSWSPPFSDSQMVNNPIEPTPPRTTTKVNAIAIPTGRWPLIGLENTSAEATIKMRAAKKTSWLIWGVASTSSMLNK